MDNVRLKSSFSVERAHKAQVVLSKKVIFEDRIPETIQTVAGVDVAYTKNLSIAAVVVLDYHALKLKEAQVSICVTSFPYIPTLLSFRELPPSLQCIHKLQTNPDIFLVNGHGYAHPYRCGFACHLGLALKKPTIGVAKNILTGTVDKEFNEKLAPLRDQGETIGVQVKKESKMKPVYVSVGNMISLGTAIKVVKHCMGQESIPEPLVLAHRMATDEKRKINMTTGYTRSVE
jgi:deoxyribonuclease V